jgi:hypothetical protein
MRQANVTLLIPDYQHALGVVWRRFLLANERALLRQTPWQVKLAMRGAFSRARRSTLPALELRAILAALFAEERGSEELGE